MRASVRRHLLHNLLHDTRGVQLIEFAYSLPVLLALGLALLEITNLSTTRMRISQIGAALGDNVARAGQNNGLTLAKLYESDVVDSFEAARIQGTTINFKGRGRVIVSSLQQNRAGGQWIAWQRCYGDKSYSSTYGTVGQGKTGTSLPGMGPASARVLAPTNLDGVIFVEIAYDYKAIVEPFAKGLQYFGLRVDNQVITYKQAFIVREPRDLGDSNDAATTSTEDFGLFQNSPTPVNRALYACT